MPSFCYLYNATLDSRGEATATALCRAAPTQQLRSSRTFSKV